jgi:acyl-coenzyme A thioesterase PaaI-like protein
MSKTPPPLPAEFEPEFITGLKAIFEEKIVFNQVLGLKITSICCPSASPARIDMKPELVGHYSYNRVHGGVISAGLDAMGGLACMAAIGARHMDETPEQRLHRFGKLGTIDLRIDYLRPGIGEHFELSAEVLRLGSRVASTRMEFPRPGRQAAVLRLGRLHRLLKRWHEGAAAPARPA